MPRPRDVEIQDAIKNCLGDAARLEAQAETAFHPMDRQKLLNRAEHNRRHAEMLIKKHGLQLELQI